MLLERDTLKAVTRRIIPFLVLCYFLAFIDRVNVSVAALTMNRDLGFSQAVFGFGAGLFFVSYFFFEVPSNIIMQKVGARRWIARIMVSWGLVAGAMAFVQGEQSFYALRLLLGVAEAGFFPAVLFYLSYWFPEAYRGRVFSYFLAAVPLAGIIGLPLSGLLLGLDGVLGLKGWQWLYLLEALPSVIVGVIAYFYLTDQPAEAKWLTQDKRAWLVQSLRAEADRPKQARPGNWSNLLDIRVICFAAIHFCGNLAIYGLGFFLPQIVKTLGLTDLRASMVAALPYVVGAIGMLYWGSRSDRGGDRRWNVFLPFVLSAFGFVGAASLSDPYLVVASLCLAAFGCLGYAPVFWTLPTAFLSGTASAIAIAAINSIGNFAGFLGPFTVGYLRDATGSFSAGLFASAAVMTTGAILILLSTRGRATALVSPSSPKVAAE
ncbi:MFS transporter [Bradyrhizobium paxllaeri]|uniref:MFS transporter n=1 Tax=Bradyrhizobium paxllaeri TaxID=190148 RepID=UPI0008107A3B|nr:MFS transporter [Bradyrhizobium paxllaeri]